MNEISTVESTSLDTETIVERARALRPALKANVRETVQARRVPDENIALLREAGMFRIVQPARCGGLELDLHAHVDSVIEISRACGATGWVMGVMHAHAWLMGLFTQAAQDEVYGDNPDALIAAVLADRGTVERVDGGYRLKGFWPFCSGCHHADWFVFGARLSGEDGTRLCLLPAGEATIRDDWYVQGLTGTGSNSVVCDDVFIPEHRALDNRTAFGNGEGPGSAAHASDLYFNAAVPALALFLCPPAVGMGLRACDAFVGSLDNRMVAYIRQQQSEMAITHIELAQARCKVDTARMLLHGVVDAMADAASRREVMEYVARARARTDCGFATRLCKEAVDTLYTATGGRGLAEFSDIGQAFLDIQAINMHALITANTVFETYGRVLVGDRSPALHV